MYTHIFYVDHFVKEYNVSVIKEKNPSILLFCFHVNVPNVDAFHAYMFPALRTH
jgi:hypothetical protein